MAKSKFSGGMGFKGFSDFNMCLLGKQYWRLLTGNSSLMQRVFKIRYYPRTSITDAKLGYTSSYAWRSILSIKYLVEGGSHWRIGNGKNVSILKDKWIPNFAGFNIPSIEIGLGEEDKVNALIDEDLHFWKLDLIQQCFHPMVVSKITSIPLGWTQLEDKLISDLEKSAEYSVRSVYHILRNQIEASLPGPSNHT